MKKTDIVFDLFDPSERDHAIAVLREAAETGDPAPGLTRPFKSYILAPLENWLQGARPGNETAEAATTFWFAARDVLERLRDGGLHLAHVNPLADAWLRFHVLAGYDQNLAFAVASVRSTDAGKKGGSQSKRKQWAEIAAKLLLQAAEGCTQDEAWEKLPDPQKEWTIETDMGSGDDLIISEYDIAVYRDGDSLVAVNKETRVVIGELKKSTFLREYYRKIKNSGK